MMDLLIVRHAIAHETNARRWRNDDLRPLTPAGIRRFTKAARGLATLAMRPARVLSSSLVRARQTAELLTSVAGWPEATETEALRPHAPPGDTLAELRRYSVKRIAVVGHEPALSTLLGACISRRAASIKLKKGGVALVSFSGKPRAGRGELLWLLTPRALRSLGATLRR